jgi:hypothetical protein
MELETIPTPVEPGSVSLFYDTHGTLRCTVGSDYSLPTPKLYQAWPLTHPRKYLSLVNGKGEEVVLLDSMDDLPEASRPVAEEELRRRYLTARVTAIQSIRTEFGVTYWHVDTDRGERDFVVQSFSESCLWLSDDHVLISDVDGNRFEIKDRDRLDPESRARLETVF